MTRTIATAILAGLTLFSVGCCYRAGGCDPCTGMTYAGQMQPVCCGPLDPFGMWCGGNSGCCQTGGQGYIGGSMQGGCCQQTPYQSGYAAPMMQPQTFANPGCYSNSIPMQEGTIQPMPAPANEGNGAADGKKSSYLVPQPMPQPSIHHGAASGQWVKAF